MDLLNLPLVFEVKFVQNFMEEYEYFILTTDYYYFVVLHYKDLVSNYYQYYSHNSLALKEVNFNMFISVYSYIFFEAYEEEYSDTSIIEVDEPEVGSSSFLVDAIALVRYYI